MLSLAYEFPSRRFNLTILNVWLVRIKIKTGKIERKKIKKKRKKEISIGTSRTVSVGFVLWF